VGAWKLITIAYTNHEEKWKTVMMMIMSMIKRTETYLDPDDISGTPRRDRRLQMIPWTRDCQSLR
jgi:hypothetical protein